MLRYEYELSIPSRGFWFFEVNRSLAMAIFKNRYFQSPRGDFGFLKLEVLEVVVVAVGVVAFNPLAGILVF